MNKIKKCLLIALGGACLSTSIPGSMTRPMASMAQENMPDMTDKDVQMYLMFDIATTLVSWLDKAAQTCGNGKECTAKEAEKLLEMWLKENPDMAKLLKETEIPKETINEMMLDLVNSLQKRVKPATLTRLREATKQMVPVLQDIKKEAYGDQKHGFYEIFASNFKGAQNRAKASSVKANMHTLQTIVETYAVDWGGVYAADVTMLKTEAEKSSYDYWKDVSNPFTGKTGLGKNGSMMDYKTYQNYKPHKDFAGLTLYAPEKTRKGEPLVKYYIYGCDKDGNLMQDKGQIFYLSNS